MEWGATLVFERPLAARSEVDLAVLGGAESFLDVLADDSGVRPLRDFASAHRSLWLEAVSADEVPADVTDEPTWHSAEEGLATVRALLRALREGTATDDPEDDLDGFADDVDVDALVTALRACEDQLARAAAEGVRFWYHAFEL